MLYISGQTVPVVRTFIFVLSATAMLASPVNADEVVTLETRSGVTQEFMLVPRDDTVANVILFTGGKGKLKFTEGWLRKKGKNFLVRTREMFAQHGFSVAVINAPSDRKGADGMKGGFRTGAEHAADIEAVVEYLTRKNGKPVWLVGTSRGTESAANGAIRIKNKLGGLVLTSSVTEPNNNGTAVTELDLARITIPTLILAHRNDDCFVTIPGRGQAIKDKLVNVPVVEFRLIEGGREPESEACKGQSPHGFFGVEDKAVSEIARFIRANLQTGTARRQPLPGA